MNTTARPASSEANAPEDSAHFRGVLGRYPTGVAAVTALDQCGAPTVLIVGTFTSASLAPPLISFLPAKVSRRWERIRAAARFCVNVLGADQEALCRSLAAPVESRLEETPWTPAPVTGAPMLEGAVAFVDCALEAVHDAGDHDFALGRVLRLGVLRDADPLVFLGGAYGGFAPFD